MGFSFPDPFMVALTPRVKGREIHFVGGSIWETLSCRETSQVTAPWEGELLPHQVSAYHGHLTPSWSRSNCFWVSLQVIKYLDLSCFPARL